MGEEYGNSEAIRNGVPIDEVYNTYGDLEVNRNCILRCVLYKTRIEIDILTYLIYSFFNFMGTFFFIEEYESQQCQLFMNILY